jgi:hypothetical protein
VEQVVTGARPPGSVYHFLLPHPNMSPFDGDKALKELAPEGAARVKAWRKTVLAPLSRAEIERLDQIGKLIDDRVRQAISDRQRVLERCRSAHQVWKQDPPAPPLGGWLNVTQKEVLLVRARGDASAYGQLQRAMQLWVALWAWPLADAAMLPERQVWLTELEKVLGADLPTPPTDEQLALPAAMEGSLADVVEAAAATDLWAGARQTSERLRPLCWELETPEAFLSRGGFDLIVGNPPWVKLQWNEQGLLEEFEPRLALDNVGASDVANRRALVLNSPQRTGDYMLAACDTQGTQAYLGAASNFPSLVGVQTNLYRCFVVRAWSISAINGVTGPLCQRA